jgi:aspartate/methionine/tyrosine aminotransferase
MCNLPIVPGIAERIAHLPGFAIDQVAAAAGDDPDVLRMENLDTDLRPPAIAIAATTAALVDPRSNSYLPFTGSRALREVVAAKVGRQTGRIYDPDREVVITCGGTEGVLDALFATVDPGDEVVLTDPTYAGLIQRVRLAGAVPKLVPLIAGARWRLDLEALAAAVGPSTRALLMMSPSMPAGAVLDRAEWEAIADACRRVDAWLLYDAAMERILFDGLPYIHPATLPGMSERTITIGSASKELRMIGWRVGWVVGPESVMSAVARAHVYNAVTATGIAQAGAAAAIAEADDISASVAEWQRRRDVVLAQLDGLPVHAPSGGWSMLLDVRAMGLGAGEAASLLLSVGKVAATPMTTWGHAYGDAFVRLVYSREPIARLETLRARVDLALG